MAEVAKTGETKAAKSKVKAFWGPWSALLVGVSAYLLPQIILGVILAFYSIATDKQYSDIFNDSTFGLNFAVSFFFALAGATILWLYVKKRGGISALGFRPLPLKQLAMVLPAYFLYLVLLVATFVAVSYLIPDINLDQNQNIGFEEAVNSIDKIYAFLALVIIAPIYEEVLFRGFIFQGFAWRMGFWPAAIVSSLLFGLAHGQWNVAIDTFILGVIASWLLWKTKSIYPAILLHGIKNAVAFVIIFV